MAHILLTYLEDQIQQPLKGFSHSSLLQILQAHQFSAELSQRVIETLFAGETSEYTPLQPASYEEVAHSGMLLLEDLEK